MNNRIVVALAFVLLALAGRCPVCAQDKELTKPAAKMDFRELQIQLANARLQLAEIELKVAVENNRRVVGLVPLVVIESLEMSLAKAKAQLATAQGNEADIREALAASADVTVKVARDRLQRLTELAKRSDVPSSELARAQLRVSIAELERESVNSLLAQPMEQQLRWQVDRINTLIDGLSDRVIVLEDKR